MLDLFDLRAVMTLERLLYKTMSGHPSPGRWRTLWSSSAIPCKRTGFRIIPFIPICRHLSQTLSSALEVTPIINGQLRLRIFRIRVATSNPSISGIWISKTTSLKEFSAVLRAPRHSNPDETAVTSQPNFSSNFLVTVLFNASSSAINIFLGIF